MVLLNAIVISTTALNLVYIFPARVAHTEVASLWWKRGGSSAPFGHRSAPPGGTPAAGRSTPRAAAGHPRSFSAKRAGLAVSNSNAGRRQGRGRRGPLLRGAAVALLVGRHVGDAQRLRITAVARQHPAGDDGRDAILPVPHASVLLSVAPLLPPCRVPPFVLITTPDDTTSPPCLSRPRPPWMPQVRLWLVMQGTHFNGGIAKISIYMGYFSVWCQFQALVSHCNKLE